MKTALILALVLTVPFAAGGCRRITRSVTEKAIEEGSGAKNVDLDKGNMTVVGKDGSKVSMGQDVKLPDNWPSSVPIYSGAKLQSSMSLPDGMVITAQTNDPPAKIVAFYKSQLSSMTTEAEVNMGQMSMVTFKGTDQTTIQITAGTNGSGTALTVTISKKK